MFPICYCGRKKKSSAIAAIMEESRGKWRFKEEEVV